MSRNILIDKPKVKIDKIVIDLGDGKQIELSPEKAIELRDILDDLFPAKPNPATRKEAPQKAEKKSESKEERIERILRELEGARESQKRPGGTHPVPADAEEVPPPYVRPFSPGPMAPIEFPWRKKLDHWTPMWAPTTNDNIKDDGHQTMCIMAKQADENIAGLLKSKGDD